MVGTIIIGKEMKKIYLLLGNHLLFKRRIEIYFLREFALVGYLNLTQKYTRDIINNKYSLKPNGISGNEDYGALSSW